MNYNIKTQLVRSFYLDTSVNNAYVLFRKKNYMQALLIYEKLAKNYSPNLFYANTLLCKKKIRESLSNNNIFISIIIPIFNTEKYIQRCLESVAAQEFKQIEVICIDDCSTDGSALIANSFKNKIKNFHYIKLDQRKGQGFARNLGIEKSIGKYIMFLDSDDWLNIDACAILYDSIMEFNVDMLLYSGYNFDFYGNRVDNNYWNYKYIKQEFPAILNRNDFINFIWLLPVSACITIYRKKFLSDNNITFFEGKYFEDNYFFIKSIINIDKIAIINKKLYNRQLHPNSTTHNSGKMLMDCLFMYNKCYDLIKKTNFSEEIKFKYIATRFYHLEQLLQNIDIEFKSIFYKNIRDFLVNNVNFSQVQLIPNEKFCTNLFKYKNYNDYINNK